MSVRVTCKPYRNGNYCTSTVTSDLSYFGKVHINWSPTLYKCMEAERHFDTHTGDPFMGLQVVKTQGSRPIFTVINTQSIIQ